jgi:NDP-sugar pyrophosphorylase family protein
MQAVLLANGVGGQLRPLTDTIPEPLLLVELEPALDVIIKRLEATGIEEIVVFDRGCSRELGALVQNGHYRAWVQVLPQPQFAGDAGLLKQIERLIHGPFVVGSVNAVFALDLRPLIEAHFRSSALVTVASLRAPMQPSDTAVHLPNEGEVWPVTGPAEVMRLMEAGAYIMDPRVLSSIPIQRSYTVASDLIPRLVSDGEQVFAAKLAARWGGLESLESYLKCQRWFLRQTHAGGFIHPSASVAPGVQLKPPYFIGPSAHVEDRAVIGPDAVLGAEAVVGAASEVSDSIICPGVSIGKRCSIRHSILAPEVCLFDDVTLEPNVIVGAGVNVSSRTVLRAGTRIAIDTSSTDLHRSVNGQAAFNGGETKTMIASETAPSAHVR